MDPSTEPAFKRSAERRGPVARLLLKALAVYQATSPVRPPRCRYLPTCSSYAVEAVERFGAGRGSWLTLRRLARCHPLGSHGYDPVPEPNRHSATPGTTSPIDTVSEKKDSACSPR